MATDVLGSRAGVALPLQRHSPALIMLMCAAEFAALAAFVLTASLAGLGALIVASLALMGLALTNRKVVLAITAEDIVVLAASLRGKPLAPLGSAPSGTTLPPANGFGVRVVIEDRTWWIDRSSFPRLRRAQELARRL